MKFSPVMVASFDVTKSSEVSVYFDSFGGKVWANIRKFAKSDRYTGPTTDGIKFSPLYLPEIDTALKKAMSIRNTMYNEIFLRVPKNKSHDLVIRASNYRGSLGVDLREWYRTPTGEEGWGRGIRLRIEYLQDLISALAAMKIAYSGLALSDERTSAIFANTASNSLSTGVEGVPEKLKNLFSTEPNDEKNKID